MNKLQCIPGILLRISPLFLGPIFLLIPSPEESPFNYFELLSLFLVLAAAWYLVLSVGTRITPELKKTKRFFFTTYLFIAVTAVLGCLTLMRERLEAEIFLLLPAVLAISSAREFLKRKEKVSLVLTAEFLTYLLLGLASCSLYLGEIKWQTIIVSLALALQVMSSSFAELIYKAKKDDSNLITFYSVSISFPSVLIAALTYFRELPVNSLATLVILALGSRLIADVRNDKSLNLPFLTDLLGLGFVVLCLLANLL